MHVPVHRTMTARGLIARLREACPCGDTRTERGRRVLLWFDVFESVDERFDAILFELLLLGGLSDADSGSSWYARAFAYQDHHMLS